LQEHALKDFNERKHVVAFAGFECPLAKLHGPRLGQLAKEYESKGVAFIGIDSNSLPKGVCISAPMDN
jgi:hypothetical protein